MGVMAGLTGNAGAIPDAEGLRIFHDVLLADEHIHQAYRLIRDAFAFTDRRLLTMDVQGMTGKKIEWHSTPYRSISHFSIETPGVGDLDSELKIWVSGNAQPTFKKTFNRNIDIREIGAVLAHHVCPGA